MELIYEGYPQLIHQRYINRDLKPSPRTDSEMSADFPVVHIVIRSKKKNAIFKFMKTRPTDYGTVSTSRFL